ncbi:MAG: DUF4255 domain-containing protein [Cyanobacteria bacterium P01_D01_bin.14]
MSNALAIAAVTITLRSLIDRNLPDDLAGATVTAKPLDKAISSNGSSTGSGNQINLFLYQTEFNSTWRNLPLPDQVRPLETGFAPLALNLHYLLTAYGEEDEDARSHRLLGQAMSTLHDHPILSADEIEAATATELPGSTLHEQIECVRIVPYTLSLDELSRLWATFQTQYRISAAYQASVVLIDSTRSTRTPLPVLSRGQNDTGFLAQADVTPPLPTLTSLVLPQRRPSLQLGQTVRIVGVHLDGSDLEVRFQHSRLDDPLVLTDVVSQSATEIEVSLPEPGEATDPAAPQNQWLVGYYSIQVAVRPPDEAPDDAPLRVTNQLPVALAPQIVTDTLPISVVPNVVIGGVTITLQTIPSVSPDQRVALLVGDRELLAQPRTVRTNTLVFQASDIPAGDYFIRLRIDGVDSLLIQDYEARPPQFDPTQQVTLP